MNTGTPAGTDKVIDTLTQNLMPMKTMEHPARRILPCVLGAGVYTWFVVQYLGVRPDIVAKVFDPFFLFEIVIALSISLSAAFAASWLCVPDMRGQRWIVSVPIVLSIVIVIWSCIRAFTQGLALPAPHWDHCFQDAVLVGTVPAAFLIFVTIRGTTTKPIAMAMMNILSVGALGYTALRFTCMMDTVGHSMVYHIFPFVVLGGLMGLLARRIFSW